MRLKDIKMVERTARITNGKGEVVFEQEGVLFPESWSQSAVNICTEKYFWGQLGTPEREHSIQQVFDRVLTRIISQGKELGYYEGVDINDLYERLLVSLLNQEWAFNSPVWFNIGTPEKVQQASACFINHLEDSLDSICELQRDEAHIFKMGSGAGVNISVLRCKGSPLAGGGTASGPVSFMRGYDAFAGVVKSGGKKRRAAKMVCMDAGHPDALEFINCKVIEEKKAQALMKAGYTMDFTDPDSAYNSVCFQNANHTIRFTDAQMEERYLLRESAEACHFCGDPGIHFSDTINKWNTCKTDGDIVASNPCSEYLFLNNTACNLASLNLVKFAEIFQFDVPPRQTKKKMNHLIFLVNNIFIMQDILVSIADYPNEKIAINSKKYRTIGLGFSNLGALLMQMGLPYDSNEGRAVAESAMALIHVMAMRTSNLLAQQIGVFDVFERNRQHVKNVVMMHSEAISMRTKTAPNAGIQNMLATINENLREQFLGDGVIPMRNAQFTVLAPTGTISFMMDCDTTGLEPAVALTSYKKLVGGGTMQIVCESFKKGLQTLGHTPEQCLRVEAHVMDTGTVVGAPYLDPKDYPVFSTALDRVQPISWKGHIDMMAAVQPFISGAISKTINMPKEATVEEIERAIIYAHESGVKCLAIYRDGSKWSQPVTVEDESKEKESVSVSGQRLKLPVECKSIRRKFNVQGHEGYVHVGLYESGQPGELFITLSKQGSTLAGFADAWAQLVSISLQHGVPIETIIDKARHQRFEPSGFVSDDKIRSCTSIIDFVAQWLEQVFVNQSAKHPTEKKGTLASSIEELEVLQAHNTGNTCHICDGLMQQAGSCHTCINCGATTGCG